VRKHWIKVLAVLGVLLVVSLLTARYYVAVAKNAKPTVTQTNASQALSDSNECTQCHEMKPEVLTWQISAHEKFACTVCHVNKKASDYVGKHQSQAFTFPIKSNEAIPNSVCLKCHSANRVTSPAGDLKIPHDKHLNAGLLCVSCHFGVVHGKIAERDLSGVVDVNNFDAWNLDIAKKVATQAYIRPSMWTCINCHKKANVTRKCTACHTTIPSLPSHDNPTWKSNHGQTARQDIGACISCHATPDQPNFVSPSTGDKAADFARKQVFCYTCHLQRPQMHEKSMIPIHPSLIAKRGGTSSCLTCHDANQPKPEENVTKFYCNQCHWDKSGDSVPKPKK
jgi:hypothetical protein